MPMYDFLCKRCTRSFEALVGPQEAGCCPECKDSEYVVRAISAHKGYTISGDNSASTRPNKSRATE